MNQHTHPVAIVTGASRGFGRALTAALLDRGWTVVGDARRANELKTTAAALDSAQLIAAPGDITDPSHRSALVTAAIDAGPLRLLVNNASLALARSPPSPTTRRATSGPSTTRTSSPRSPWSRRP